MQDCIVQDISLIKGKIKTIIFDFGGVIFNIDYQIPINQFKKLGFKNFELFYDKSGQTNLFDQLEIGAISPDYFAAKIKESAPEIDVTEDEILCAWNSILLDIPKERIMLIQELQRRYKTLLLSNTNAIHVERFLEIVDETMTLDFFNSSFTKIYYSNEMGMRKPNSDIFEKVISDNQLIPSETLFIDDSIQHVRGAAQVGIYSYHLDVDTEDILTLFEDWTI